MRLVVILLLMLFVVPSYSGTIIDFVETQAGKKVIIHTVQKGETVSSILKNYNLSLDKFLKTNKQLNGTNLTLSLGQQLLINKKDVGTASDVEIAHQIKVYLQSHGTSTSMIDELPQKESQKAELIRELNRVEKYDDTPRGNGKLSSWNNKIKVTLLLPLTKKDGTEDKEFEAFYKGAVLAMSQLKNDGISLDVDVFDTNHSVESVNNLINEGVLRSRNIVIGPVYNDQFTAVANYLHNRGTILVSPLAAIDAIGGNVFQLAPSQMTRYDKLENFFSGKNVIFFATASDDKSFDSEIKEYTNMGASTKIVRGDVGEDVLKGYFVTERPNVVVVSAKNKSDIELALSRVANIKRTLSSNYNIAVVGSPEFSKVDERKREDFFKANTYYTTNYHQDRLDEKSLEFERQYVDMFGEYPNLFSYRAYDALILFLSVMYESGEDFYSNFNDQLMQLLQVKYRFVLNEGRNVNTEWMLVNYKPNYTITIK